MPVWGQTKTPNYNPNSDLPPYDAKEQSGTVRADFSTDGSASINTYPRRTSYVDNPNWMTDTLQRENNPTYNSTTGPQGNVPLISDPNYPSRKPPLPPKPATDTIPEEAERLPGGTTRVLQPGDMLTPDGQPTNGISYQSSGYMANQMPPDSPFSFNESWTWQVLPGSIIYKSYLASNRESRMGSQMVHVNNLGNFWDVTLGGRVGILRYGNTDPYEPQGYQLDIEGAAFPRLNFDHDRDLDDVDFRFGIPLTMRQGAWETKFGYYHLSSHLGDEYMVRNNTLDRLNYVRESLMLGVGLFLNPNFRLYSEIDYAFHTDGGAKPLEFQFGAEYSPVDCNRFRGSPFLAVNGHLHQEVNYSGSVTAQIGWQWRGRTGHLLRTGFQYFNGMSEQAQFFDRFEAQYGWGLWYDF
jgi:hypothetical protein